MYKTDAQIAAQALHDQRMMMIIRAKQKNDIHELLRPWYTFRIYLRFKKPFYKNGEKRDKSHFHGYEENCSYNQCWHGHVNEIQMNKLKGWEECVRMAEKGFCDREGRPLYRYAKVFQRTEFPDGKFNTLCREYNDQGEIIYQQDPVIVPETRTLYFLKSNVGLMVTEDIVPAESDWSEMVAKALNKIDSHVRT